ncbi:hypothetical protein [Bradyrhizobium sp.]|jgi:hypothetical protein
MRLAAVFAHATTEHGMTSDIPEHQKESGDDPGYRHYEIYGKAR